MELPIKYRKSSENMLRYWESNPVNQSPRKTVGYDGFMQICANPQNKVEHEQIAPYQQQHKGSTREVRAAACTLFLLVLMGVLLVFLFLDVRHQFEEEIKRNEIKKEECNRDYIQNQCAQPLDALIEKCKQIGECSNMDTRKAVRISQKFAKVVGTFIKVLCQHLTAFGMLFVIVFALIYLHYSVKKQELMLKVR